MPENYFEVKEENVDHVLRKLMKIIAKQEIMSQKLWRKIVKNLDENKLGDSKSQDFIILVRGDIPKFIDLLYWG